MNVCMVAYSFYETDNRVRRYAEYLASLGNNVDVIALRNPNQNKFENIKGVNVYRLQKRKFDEKGLYQYFSRILVFMIRTKLFIIKKHLRERYHIFHMHSIPDYIVFTAFIPKLFGAKIILDIHDLVPELFLSKFKANYNSIFFKALLLIEKLSIKFSDHVIIANHIWYDRLIDRSIQKSNCTVIMNYPDPKIFNIQNRTSIDESFKLIYPGTFSWYQGIDIAIKALAHVLKEIPNVQLHLYGDGNDKQRLINLTNKLNIKENVKFFEEVPLEEIAVIMKTADIGIEPKQRSRFSDEAFSTKILEFMMLGVPVIASDTKIHKYYFNGRQVQFFKSNDEKDLARKICFLLKHPEKRTNLVNEANKTIYKFNWDYRKKIYNKLLQTLLH